MKYSWTQAIFDFFCLRLNKCLYRTREAEAIEREKEKREGKNTKVIYRTLVDIRLCSLYEKKKQRHHRSNACR